MAILGDTSTQLLSQAIRGYGFEVGFDLDIFEADYNQIDRQILDSSSELYRFKPDFVLLFQASQKLIKSYYRKDNSGKVNFAKNQIQKISDWVAALNAGAKPCKIICTNFAEIDDSVFGNFSNKTNLSFQYQLRKLNCELMDFSQGVKNLFIADVSALQNLFGVSFSFEPRMYIDADMVFSLDFLPPVAKSILDIILAVSGIFKKCLIMDLDNTLWGGIIGDDGIENIQLGDLGQGKAFSELQAWAKQLKKRGILLAVCSKNSEQIAREPFEKHPDMVLSLEDIAVFAASWDSKIDNIKYIKSFLNIGYDSMVFIDDNPFERNVIRTHLPDVTVPELPDDPSDYLPYLRTLNLFETSSYTEEDEQRTLQLQAEGKRATVQKTFTSEDDFLRSLGMTCEIAPFDNFTIPRVAQLIQRSNQFNLRTIRYSEHDIRRFVEANEHLHYAFSLKDKFGDYGLISLVILRPKEDGLFIDTWVMSCRVLNRGVENLILTTIVNAAKDRGYEKIMGEYIPTLKNVLVKDHYLNLGFNDIGNGCWALNVINYQAKKHFINQGVNNGY